MIELGTSAHFTTLQQAFLRQVMPSIGIAVNASESRSRTEALLKQSQEQAVLLKAQQTEMEEYFGQDPKGICLQGIGGID